MSILNLYLVFIILIFFPVLTISADPLSHSKIPETPALLTNSIHSVLPPVFSSKNAQMIPPFSDPTISPLLLNPISDPVELSVVSSSPARLSPDDLQYIGAFRVPISEDEEYGWAYGGGGLSYYPAGDPMGGNDGYPGLLFGMGHDQKNKITEISIPQPVISPDKQVTDLNTAGTIQSFTDLNEGIFTDSGQGAPLKGDVCYIPKQTGQSSDHVYFTFAEHLEFDLVASLASSTPNLASPLVQGPWKIGTYSNFCTNDYLFEIPASWSDEYLPGYRLAAGRFRDGSLGGSGPSLFALAPWKNGNPPSPQSILTSIRPLLLYEKGYEGSSRVMEGFNNADEWSGGAWVTAGDKSAILFVGTKGRGNFWYGFSDGTVWPDDPPFPPIPSPPHDERGWWAESFEGVIYFYDPGDLAQVAQGLLEPYEPQPYAELKVDQYLYHISSTQQKRHLGDVTYDRTRGNLYLTEFMGDGDNCLIHVWKITGASSPTLESVPVFPSDHIWNVPVNTLPVHIRSSDYITKIGSDSTAHPDFGAGLWEGNRIGIPYVMVPGSQEKKTVIFEYSDESDPGPYPIPDNPPIEGGSDHHIIIIDKDNKNLYELYAAEKQPDGSWHAGSCAIFDLTGYTLRPAGWTSADAAGLAILPGLVRYEEVKAGEISHAIRFTAPSTQRAYVWPARHFASEIADSAYPPMGQRFRLKSSFDITGYPPQATVVLKALKKYGMILADNGAAWFLSGVPDERWDNDDLYTLQQLKGSDFEAVDSSSLMIHPDSGRSVSGVTPTNIGVFRGRTWYLDYSGNNVWGTGDKTYTFGLAGDVPLTGDWNGDGKSDIGVFRGRTWYLDYSGNGVWGTGDKTYTFGLAGDVPLTGDWNGDGKSDIGVFRGRTWYLDYSGNGVWGTGDKTYTFGLAGDVPLTGDWNGDGKSDIGVFRGRMWYLDYSGNNVWGTGDKTYTFGLAGDVPLTGDWNGDGKSDIGVFRGRTWYLDYSGNGVWGTGDKTYTFGLAGDVPITGSWSGLNGLATFHPSDIPLVKDQEISLPAPIFSSPENSLPSVKMPLKNFQNSDIQFQKAPSIWKNHIL
ncbi:hypothetical protein KHC33_01230 [Methanospirillum sp. J.3.6.1-F.2.7.3]|uniref:Uncharacterized protein n=1 Tax=Methanospirillum purgamenti TaxID=2834276 RepID=A0A8E7EHC9_9EURY|nr:MULTISPECIES: VCBS repeat-containing protein [Methanospirillum]MDX8551792.1 VCBS repeat-containing protein [Methanospirillum hungatei]QVV89188.1 hypothetical protein KHC33_01230 [Methanospirillum sp. J.3.6.1-F.2.7.3]